MEVVQQESQPVPVVTTGGQRGRPISVARRRRRYQRHQFGPNGGPAATATSGAANNNNNTTSHNNNNNGSNMPMMSTGKRLAKRSIIGTRVCAPGADGKYYAGVISAVNTPAQPQQPELGGLSITPQTRYSVRFDPAPAGSKAPDSKNEYKDRDLIGPGFGSIVGAKLVAGQRVYLTYNGREIQAEVVEHLENLDEVKVKFVAPGQECTTKLTKRIDEVRLLESRKSARLADSDTDFARLADMGSDRKRASSNSIEVPQINGSRKRRPSSSNDSERNYGCCNSTNHGREGFMDECSAAMVLMSLSTPPKYFFDCQRHYGQDYWEEQGNRTTLGSPSVSGATSNSSSGSSPSSSWRGSTPSPPLSDEGVLTGSSARWNNSASCNSFPSAASSCTSSPGSSVSDRFNHQNAAACLSRSPVISDEGFDEDSDENKPRKKKIRCKVESPPDYTRNSSSSLPDEKQTTLYRCVWRDDKNGPQCDEISYSWDVLSQHVKKVHFKGKNACDNDEDFYIVDEQLQPTCSPPTKSHWDMVRPRSEDPEYQKQLHLAAIPSLNNPQNIATYSTQNIIISEIHSVAPNTPNKQFKPAAPVRPGPSGEPINLLTVSLGKMPHSPRRVRGETKKCRKVYGMERKELWCTQCKWKKACTRFMD